MLGRRCTPLALIAVWSATCTTIIGGAAAQEKEPPPAVSAPLPEEADVLAQGAKEIATYAALCFKNGFPARARQAWLEVLGEYAPDDEDTRKALGFYRHGAVWQRDPKFEYPDQDQLNASVARMLEQRWQSLTPKLGEMHRALAEQLAAAGKQDRASYHAQRALRFTPNDAKAVAQGGMKQIEGIAADEIDAAVLQRSRRMDRAIAKLSVQAFPATLVDEKLAILDKAGIQYRAVKSENFLVYGDWEVEVLIDAAAWAERSLAFCKEAYEGFAGFPSRSSTKNKFVFLKTKETWVELVRKSSTASDVEFVVNNAAATEIGDVETATAESVPLVNDFSVRWVAQNYTGVSSDALQEGIGHAIVGMFFGRNLVFSVGQQKKEGTVSGPREQAKLLLPDMETWKELAVEIAWQQGGTPAARLPLLKAAQFPDDGRIKAWSFCDYLLRRDPLLLKRLDQTAAKARTERDVLGLFQEYAGQPLQHVEDRWRRFWTEDSPLRRAIVAKTTPLETASKEAPEWLDLFNKLRQQSKIDPVGWSTQFSVACKDHVDYLKANKDQRGADKEHTQLAGKPGYTNAGRAFAALALVWTKDQKKAAESWMSLPGYRDAVLNSNIDTVGVYAEGGLMVLDASRGRSGDRSKSFTRLWPLPGGTVSVPAAVDVELLGPEVQRLLADNKRGKQKQIGYPLSLHLYDAGSSEVTCTVTCQGDEVPGFLVQTKGTIRRTSAPGLWVFYPADPLKRGVEHKAAWKWPKGSESVKFTAN